MKLTPLPEYSGVTVHRGFQTACLSILPQVGGSVVVGGVSSVVVVVVIVVGGDGG